MWPEAAGKPDQLPDIDPDVLQIKVLITVSIFWQKMDILFCLKHIYSTI